MGHERHRRPAAEPLGQPRRAARARNPGAVYLRFEGGSVTWAQLHERVSGLAAALRERGVRAGDRVAIMMTNRPAATVGEILDIPLERPRKRLDLADDATYAHCRGEVLRFLYARHRPADADAA